MEPELGAAPPPQFRSGEMLSAFDEVRGLISAPPLTGGSSFTALLELPPPQAVELLGKEDFPAKHPPPPPPIFPTDIALVRRASKFSVFASADNLLERNAILSDSNLMKLDAVKQEQFDAGSRRNSSSPEGSDQSPKSGKRKEREKKVKESNKKSKNTVSNEPSDDGGGGGGGEELPYVHVRARRGQATDSHSLAERARREKINARMKLLQEIVPGCNKVSGTAMVLDEIINHVQALQRQVEFLSMKLAAVSPGIDFDFDSLFPVNGASNVTGYSCMFTPPIYTEGQMNGTRQLQLQQLWHSDELQQPVWATEADPSNFIAPADSLLTYHSSSANSAFQHPGQLKTEV